MAGPFVLFTDFHSDTRFRVLAADGAVLAVSQACPDKITAAKAINEMRECAGMGLVQDHSAIAPTMTGLPRSYRRCVPRTEDTAPVTVTLLARPGEKDMRPLDLVARV